MWCTENDRCLQVISMYLCTGDWVDYFTSFPIPSVPPSSLPPSLLTPSLPLSLPLSLLPSHPPTLFHIPLFSPLTHSLPLSLSYPLQSFPLSAVNPPMITVQPVSLMLVVPGQSATFTVTATGSNLMYQWQKNGVNIATGANSAIYTIDMVAESDEGEYQCVASNTANSVTSTAASLTVCKWIKENRPLSSFSPSYGNPGGRTLQW